MPKSHRRQRNSSRDRHRSRSRERRSTKESHSHSKHSIHNHSRYQVDREEQKRSQIISEPPTKENDEGSCSEDLCINEKARAAVKRLQKEVKEEIKEPAPLSPEPAESELQKLFGIEDFNTTKQKDHSKTSVEGIYRPSQIRKFKQSLNLRPRRRQNANLI